MMVNCIEIRCHVSLECLGMALPREGERGFELRISLGGCLGEATGEAISERLTLGSEIFAKIFLIAEQDVVDEKLRNRIQLHRSPQVVRLLCSVATLLRWESCGRRSQQLVVQEVSKLLRE